MKKPNNIGDIAKLVFLSTVLIPLGTNLTLPSTALAGKPYVTPDNDQQIKNLEKAGYENERAELNENIRDAKDDTQDMYKDYYGLAKDDDDGDPGFSDGPIQVAANPADEPKYASNDAPPQTVAASDNVQRIKVKDAILSCKIESTTLDKKEEANTYTKVSYSVPQTDTTARPATGFTPISFMGNAKPDNSIKQKTYPETVLASVTSMFPGVGGMLSMPGLPKELAVIASGTRTPLAAVQGLAQPAISTANDVAGKIKGTKASLQTDKKPAKAPKSPPKNLANGAPSGRNQDPQAQKCSERATIDLKGCN